MRISDMKTNSLSLKDKAMKSINLFMLLCTAALLTSCCNWCDPWDPCGPQPCCPKPCCDYDDDCDDSGYCARPYLWDHYT